MKRSNSTTERLFRDSGISQGMHVLELGCGPGEVTEVLSMLVGPTGSVLALDHNQSMLASSRERLKEVANVSFAHADLNGTSSFLTDIGHGSFDAIAGRRVLMYLAQPTAALQRLLPWLKQGGLVVFEESDSTLCPGRVQVLEAHEKALALLDTMLEIEGVDRSMGFNLPSTLVNAGLEFSKIGAEAVIEGQGEQYTLSELLNLLSPRFEATGVATAADVRVLANQIEKEADPSKVFVSSMRFCAVAKKR